MQARKMEPIPATAGPSFGDLFTPKLVTVLREGYGLPQFRADLAAGLTVAIVALPLSMAIAIASGVSPDRGLFTAIVGGFLVSALGGSRFQIGGPAGAFIVLVAATRRPPRRGRAAAGDDDVRRRSSGDRLSQARHLHQVHPLSGDRRLHRGHRRHHLRQPAQGPVRPDACRQGARRPAAEAAGARRGGRHGQSGRGRRRPADHRRHPGAEALAAVMAGHADRGRARGGRWRRSLPCRSRRSARAIGGIPRTLPLPALPPFNLDKAQAVLPDAIAFALLGAIESLLSAVVADGMTGRRHRSNCELVAQGFANIGSALFGGICVTGTIARTATNVRAGAHGPVSGMLHAALPARLHAARRTAGQLHPACGARRRAGGGRLEHGREGRLRARSSAPRAATRWCCSSLSRWSSSAT